MKVSRVLGFSPLFYRRLDRIAVALERLAPDPVATTPDMLAVRDRLERAASAYAGSEVHPYLSRDIRTVLAALFPGE